MLMKILSVLVFLLFVITANAKDVYVTSTSSSICKKYYLSEYETLHIHYTGARLSGDCEITVDAYSSKDLCVEASTFDVDGCDTTLSYYSGISEYSLTFKETYSCYGYPGTWCPDHGIVKIKLSKSIRFGSSNTDISLKVYQTGDDDFSTIGDIAKSVVVTTYIIIGVVIGAIVLIAVIITIIVCCVCNKRRHTSGTVYQNTQPPPGTYPTTTAYQYPQPGVYPQTGYQPAPQAGYQPAPQAGYQPGYQPPPQAAGQNIDYKQQASAPPSEIAMQPVQPPPYPGTGN